MRCEKCGAADAQVIKQTTAHKGTRISRIYKCQECGEAFLTSEIYETRYATLLKGAKIISEMAAKLPDKLDVEDDANNNKATPITTSDVYENRYTKVLEGAALIAEKYNERPSANTPSKHPDISET